MNEQLYSPQKVILWLEDRRSEVRLSKKELEDAGFHVEMTSAIVELDDFFQEYARFEKPPVTAIILDVMIAGYPSLRLNFPELSHGDTLGGLSTGIAFLNQVMDADNAFLQEHYPHYLKYRHVPVLLYSQREFLESERNEMKAYQNFCERKVEMLEKVETETVDDINLQAAYDFIMELTRS
jgi:hypothetical protein